MGLHIYSSLRKYLRSVTERISLKEEGRLWFITRIIRATLFCALIGLLGFSPWIVLAFLIGINQIGNIVLNVSLFGIWLLYTGAIMILAAIVGYIRESSKMK